MAKRKSPSLKETPSPVSRAVAVRSNHQAWRYVVGIVIVLAAIYGGLSYRIQKSAADVMAFLTRSIPGSEVSYDTLTTRPFRGEVYFQNLRIDFQQVPVLRAEKIRFRQVGILSREGIQFRVHADAFSLNTAQWVSSLLNNSMPWATALRSVLPANVGEHNINLETLDMKLLSAPQEQRWRVEDFISVAVPNAVQLQAVHYFDVASLTLVRPENGAFSLEFILGGYNRKTLGEADPFDDVSVSFDFVLPSDGMSLEMKKFSYARGNATGVLIPWVTFETLRYLTNVPYQAYYEALTRGQPTPEPDHVDFSINGFAMNLPEGDPRFAAFRRAGYEAITGDFESTMSWDDQTRSLDFTLDVALREMASLRFVSRMVEFPDTRNKGGLATTEAYLVNPPKMQSLSLTLVDQPARRRLLKAYQEQGINLAIMIPLYVKMASDAFADAAMLSTRAAHVQKALVSFLSDGGELTLTSTPVAPIPVLDLADLKKAGMQKLVEILNLKATYTPLAE